ncbi:DNA recombination protein RmuC [Mariprofundus sp. NF]|uniref:DNA recombination protein RmuC n=1 Tax=Mariprofundus sp. NF TaxID=2608716 RepID=UPI001F50B68A|nr:DNA recombination protein RmuC [Mariprofundus sp. NF]
MIDWGVLNEPVAIGLLILTALFLLGWLLTYHNQNRNISELEADLASKELLVDSHIQESTELKINSVQLSEQLRNSVMHIGDLEKRLAASSAAVDGLNREMSDAKANIRELETRSSEERKSSAEKLALLEDAKSKLGNEFKILANQIFEERGKTFSEQNRNSIDEVLKPMREQLSEFRKRVDDVHLTDSKDRASLKEHLAQLEKLNRQMSEDAVGLTQALKGESKAQGNWGEMILERILETSGLREGHEFLREDSTTIDVNRRLRPDVIVRMPGEKHIIIDSKVSLTDYERAISSTDTSERSRHTKALVGSMKSHIKGLADKHYAHLPGLNSPDYVLMFMPIEGAYMMAIEADQGVFEAAFEKGVAVVTPSTLYATLKLIEQLWRAEKQSENMVRLIDRAGKLHDKMASFVESFEEIGMRLDQAQKAFDTSLNRIKTGPGNVISQIDTLGKLAGKTKKELPKYLTETAALQDQTEEKP